MLAEATRGSIDEAYQGAVSSSNLRVGNDHTLPTPGDLTAAAGMNRHRMGLSLLRLRTEWGNAARPLRPTPEQIAEHARTMTVEAQVLRIAVTMTEDQIIRARADHQLEKLKDVSWCSVLEIPNPHAGKVRVVNPDKIEYQLPLKVARRERWHWYEHEVNLALMTMRTLPGIRDAMLVHAEKQEWGCDAHVIGQVLLWWLEPKCTICGGNREEVVAGTGRTNGKGCPHCKGTGLENQGDPPCGRRGVLLAGYINGCLQAARKELGEGVYRVRRTMAGESARGERLKPLQSPSKSTTLAPNTAQQDAGDADRKSHPADD